jgi:hypothetical protein
VKANGDDSAEAEANLVHIGRSRICDHLRPEPEETLSIAALVGTVFFSMNQLSAVMAGQVTLLVGLKAALAYIVPLCVSNYGILAASRAGAQSSSPGMITDR